jgi:hypothetical protein
MTLTFTKKDMSRANLSWSINGITLVEPSREELLSMVSDRDYAILKPPPSKADQWGTVWGNLPIYLTFDKSKSVNAASALRTLELNFPVDDIMRRRRTPLFCANDWKPLTGSFMDIYIQAALQAVGCQTKYSWHGFRASLACRLLAAKATNPQIQALCRWQSKESLRIYAKLTQQDYHQLLDDAYAQDISQIQYAALPKHSDLQMVQSMSNFQLPASFDDA